MNINEEMNQLGQIGGTGYSASDNVVDHLVTRTRRSRAFRQGAAALVGSVGAIGLGLLGAQVFVNLSHDDSDAATIADRNFNLDNMSWEDRYGAGYTGLGKTQDELAQAWADLQAAAAAKTEEPTPAKKEPAPTKTTTTPSCETEYKIVDDWKYWRSPETDCEWVKKHKIEPPPPAGWISFGGILGECKTYHDVATGTDVWAAYIDAGDWSKLVTCEGGPTDFHAGSYRYIYKYGTVKATLAGTTCTGAIELEAGGTEIWQYSCNPCQSEWVYIRDVTPTPTPTPDPTPSST